MKILVVILAILLAVCIVACAPVEGAVESGEHVVTRVETRGKSPKNVWNFEIPMVNSVPHT